MRDLRSLPQVDALSRHERLGSYPEGVRLSASRAAIASVRASLVAGVDQDVVDAAVEEAERMSTSSIKRVLNASGVILHTGLGRARLAPSVVQRLYEGAGSHAAIEFDLDEGVRGDRQNHVRELLCELTGAEDAMVVNNAAAALVLTLSALAAGQKVVLSRGQMVEIGGSFRIPEIVLQSGCALAEVGCTNKTRLSDYERAMVDGAGAILRCHTSNYKIIGFTSQPELRELASLAARHSVPMIDDQGTGCLVDTSRFGLKKVPTVRDSVEGGADVTVASCDKLLGGPQAGMILGSRSTLVKIAAHPFARVVRVDKLTLFALEATLKLYKQGREEEIPAIKYLAASLDDVRVKAETLANSCRHAVISDGQTEIGGGSAPGTAVPTVRVGIGEGQADELARQLRSGKTAILGRIENGRVWLDPRTLEEDEVGEVACRLKELNC